jgi:cell division protease FtsH
VHKISIVPRGRAALGFTLQLPEGDQYLMSRSELTDKIKGFLGGRAAEEVVFGEVSTGAENDLEQATALARKMVCTFGMSERIGLARSVQRHPSPWVNGAVDGELLGRDCSEETAREIDEEVKKILHDAYTEAKELLLAHHDQLDAVVQALLQSETLDAKAFEEILTSRLAA